MLSMVDFVMSYYRVAVGSNLYASERVTEYVIVLYQPSPFTEYIHPTLMAIVNFIFPVKDEKDTIKSGIYQNI